MLNNSMLNFCTLFDSNYLSKGLVMYYSLKNVCNNFHLYIFSFDELSFELLTKLNLENATIISLKELETEELLKIKPSRSVGEYCWTCKGPSIQYCFDNFNIDHCTYLDSDLFFINDPKILFEELGENDVMLTEHRFTKEYDYLIANGKYCAGFMYFRKSQNGLEILDWWTNLCIDWCFSKHEDGKFGDQKYLDKFETLYNNVCDLKHLGGGVAPWNLQQYKFFQKDGELYGVTKNDNINFKVIFYHFHFLNISKMKFLNEFYIGPYLFSKSDIKFIYKPYINELINTNKLLASMNQTTSKLFYKEFPITIYRLFGHILKNLFRKNKLFYFNFKK